GTLEVPSVPDDRRSAVVRGHLYSTHGRGFFISCGLYCNLSYIYGEYAAIAKSADQCGLREKTAANTTIPPSLSLANSGSRCEAPTNSKTQKVEIIGQRQPASFLASRDRDFAAITKARAPLLRFWWHSAEQGFQ